jgi:hypothetical protein
MVLIIKGCAVLVRTINNRQISPKGVDGAHDDPLDQGAGDQRLDVWLCTVSDTAAYAIANLAESHVA